MVHDGKTTVKATLGGKPILAESGIGWTLRSGVLPHIEEIPMSPIDANTLRNNPGPLTLIIKPLEGNQVKVDQLWVLDVIPGPNPFISLVRVADRRWMWSYAHVLRRFNMRRNIGFKRIFANDKIPGKEEAFAGGVGIRAAYWDWSLKNGNRRWVPIAVMAEIMKEVAGAEKKFHGATFRTIIDNRLVGVRQLPIENLQIDDSGGNAVSRALIHLQGADVYVDYNGDVKIYSKVAGDEVGIAKALVPHQWDKGHADLVKNDLIRPKEIHVLFTREVELRLDHIEVASAQRATVTNDPLPFKDQRKLINVVSLTDYQLLVRGRLLPQGTWIDIDDAFRVWGTLPRLGKKIDHNLVQRAFIPGMDLWAAIGASGSFPDRDAVLKPWIGRIQEIENRYRQTYQINPGLMNTILSFRANRVGLVNPQFGTRGPSRVYGDYCIIYTQRSIWKNVTENRAAGDLVYAMNRTAFPDATSDLGIDSEFSPATVSIVDHDQGIIHFAYRGTNPITGDSRTILPSQIVERSLPTASARNRDANITFDSIINAQNPPRLSPSFNVSTIITCVPASPNTNAQLHKIVVKPSDSALQTLIPDGAKKGLGEAKGPIMTVRIGANVEPARVAWNDKRSADIEKIFGIQEGEPNLTGLVMNESEGTNPNLAEGGSITRIAYAEAARIYASLADRYEGEMTSWMNGNVTLAGWAQYLSHKVTPDGVATTMASFPADIPRLSMLAFLDANTRAIILRLVQPQ